MTTLLKFLLVVFMAIVIIITAIIYLGAGSITGKISILTSGVLVYILMGFYYSWLALSPASFKDWLKH